MLAQAVADNGTIYQKNYVKEEIQMENKFLGYENEAELVERADTNVDETGAGSPAIITAITRITHFATNNLCPTSSCTSYCGK